MKTQLKIDILLDANSMICGRLFDWVLERRKKNRRTTLKEKKQLSNIRKI